MHYFYTIENDLNYFNELYFLYYFDFIFFIDVNKNTDYRYGYYN